MDSRRVGRSGLEVSRLALGTMTWGRDTDADDAAAQLEAFVGAGGTPDRHREHLRRRGRRIDPRHPGARRGAALVGGAGHHHRRGRRRPRPAARGAGSLAGPARHRPRRPLAGARVRHVGALRGDLLGAAHGGRFRSRPVRRGVGNDRLAARHHRRRAARVRHSGTAGVRRVGVLAGRARAGGFGAAGRRRARPRSAGLGAAGSRRADRQVPARHARPTPAARHRISPGTSAGTAPSTPPASSRPSRRPPTGWARHRWRWPARGSATGPACPASSSAPGTARSCWARWRRRHSPCPPRSAPPSTTSAAPRSPPRTCRSIPHRLTALPGAASASPARRLNSLTPVPTRPTTANLIRAAEDHPRRVGAIVPRRRGGAGRVPACPRSSPSSAPPACGPVSGRPWRASWRRPGSPARRTSPPRSWPSLPRMTDRRANRLMTSFVGAGHLYELAELLVPQEIPARWALRLADALDAADAAQALRTDPWRLLLLPDATVAQADRLARSIDPDVRRDDPRRGRALVAWTLARFARDGHTAAPGEHGRGGAPAVRGRCAQRPGRRDSGRHRRVGHRSDRSDRLGRAVGEPEGAGRRGVLGRRPTWPGWSARPRRWPASGRSRACCPGWRPRPATTGLDAVQAGAVGLAAAHGVSLLTGGPGTGKSRTVAAIVALCSKVQASIALAAPTGRAAKRLEELAGSTADHGAPAARRAAGAGPGRGFARSSTTPTTRSTPTWSWSTRRRCSTSNWPPRCCAACADGTHLVIVGDPAQLPSIGPGRVLGDLIDCGTVPVTELTHAVPAGRGRHDRPAGHRRPGRRAARRSTTRPTRSSSCRPAARRRRRTGSSSWSPTRSRGRLGIAADQVQVVTPVHRGPAGTPGAEPGAEGGARTRARGTVRGFDAGDRVVATANHLDAEPTGYANGEVGTVVASGDGTLRGRVHRRPSRRSAGRRWPTCCTAGRSPCTGRRARSGRRSSVVLPPEAGGDAVPAAGLHRADPGAAAPVGGARGRPAAGARGPADRLAAPPNPSGGAVASSADADGQRRGDAP